MNAPIAPPWLSPEADQVLAAVLDLQPGDKFFVRDELRGQPRQGVWTLIKRVSGGWRMEMAPDGERDTFTDKEVRDLRMDGRLTPMHRNPLNVSEEKLRRVLSPKDAKPLRVQLEIDAKIAYCKRVEDLLEGRELRDGSRTDQGVAEGNTNVDGTGESMPIASVDEVPMTFDEACAISAVRTFELCREQWMKKLREIRSGELSLAAGEPRTASKDDPRLRSRVLHPVTGKAVAKWCKARRVSNMPETILTPDHKGKGNRTRRRTALFDGKTVYEIMNDAGKDYYIVPEKMSVRAIHRMLCNTHPGFKSQIGTHTTLQRYFDARYSPLEVSIGRNGIAKARDEFAVHVRTRRPPHPMMEVEIDHCLADIVVVDDVSDRPLGRPWITAMLDRCTRMIVGVHMSFEYPSWGAVSRCMTHAFWPKDLRAYRADEGADPERTLVHDWPCEGICESLFTDQGKDFVSESMDAASAALGFAHAVLPGRSPWLKGAVERFFGTMQVSVFSHLEGKTFMNAVERGDYDSVGKASKSFGELNFELLRWIVDDYHVQFQQGLQDYPLAAWRKRSVGQRIKPAPDFGYLIQLLGKASRGTIGSDGIRHLTHVYRHPDLAALRGKNGKSHKYHIRFDQFDLGSIWFLPSEGGSYVRAWSDRPEETVGVSEYMSAKRREFVRRFGDRMTKGDDLELVRMMDERAREIMMDKDGKGTVAKVARYFLQNGAFFTPVCGWDGKPAIHPMMRDVRGLDAPALPAPTSPDVDPTAPTGAAPVDDRAERERLLLEERRRLVRDEEDDL